MDYYPYGMVMPGRSYSSPAYRYGYNGQEKSNEVKGSGTHNTAKYGELDTRLGRRWNLDPKPNSSLSNYTVFKNNPLWYTDVLLDTPSAKEAAYIADHVYGPLKDGTNAELIGGWKKQNLNIPGVVYRSDDGYDAGLYSRTNSNGKTEYVFATRGSEELIDWKNNGQQVYGDSKQYETNAKNAQALMEYFGSETDLTFVGHSLGGGLAAANSMVTGRPAFTFNAAGVSIPTKWIISETVIDFAVIIFTPVTNNINAYIVEGELVNSLQKPFGLDADGVQKEISVSWTSMYKYDPTGVSKHMMGAVKNALENEGIK